MLWKERVDAGLLELGRYDLIRVACEMLLWVRVRVTNDNPDRLGKSSINRDV
jgi:hypothetical protein